ncbi:Lsr2 family DNA-binding protein [Streptomyces antibioticus]|uniref:Lsr2 family DNA-binding protein n=1 Tax=Streptomyces antibioticus TaxID=1890 RepID=UPI0033AD832C
MTIHALRRLLDQIDHEGGPEAARNNRLHLMSERTAMTTAPANPSPAHSPVRPIPSATAEEPQPMSVGQLLAWGDQHPDKDIQDQAARARLALAGLRKRHTADQELAAITTEAEHLEKRLAELRARKAELAPAKKTKTARDYDPAAVRAWAEQAGIHCPERGRVPQTGLNAWRASQASTA